MNAGHYGDCYGKQSVGMVDLCQLHLTVQQLTCNFKQDHMSSFVRKGQSLEVAFVHSVIIRITSLECATNMSTYTD
jgi:hypothetical protein